MLAVGSVVVLDVSSVDVTVLVVFDGGSEGDEEV